MSDRTEMAEKSMMYQLHFISIEAIADLNNKISKGYKGKVADIVRKILIEDNELSTNKKVNIDFFEVIVTMAAFYTIVTM